MALNLKKVFEQVLDRPLTREIQACGPVQARINYNDAWLATLQSLIRMRINAWYWSIRSAPCGGVALQLIDEEGSRLTLTCSALDPVIGYSLSFIAGGTSEPDLHTARAAVEFDRFGNIMPDPAGFPDNSETQKTLYMLWRIVSRKNRQQMLYLV